MFHRAILKASLGRMSKKQQQHQNQQQQQNLLLRESQNRRGRGSKDSSIARASLEVSLDNADTVIDAPGSRPFFGDANLGFTVHRGTCLAVCDVL